MDKKQIFTLAMLGALMPQQAVHAAIDEAGMNYVSASEGFGGSIRLNLLHKFQRELLTGDPRAIDHPRDGAWETNYGSSRLYLNGDMNLSSNWMATYYFEFRPSNDSSRASESPGQSGTEIVVAYQDIGLQGPFGWFRAGTIESVSSAILPSADRTNDIGTSGHALAQDYDNGVRWISPEIRGLKLGVSFTLKDRLYTQQRNSVQDEVGLNEFKDKKLDEWDVAATYSIEDLLEFGLSYAQRNSSAIDDEDASGFRIGIGHSRNSWGVSYNFHRYKAYNPYQLNNTEFAKRSVFETERFVHYAEYNSSPSQTAASTRLPNGVLVRGSVEANQKLGETESLILDFNEHTIYNEHVVGANMFLGKFNFAVNYSISTTENDIVDTSNKAGIQSLAYTVRGLRGDIGYNLGSKSKIIVAAKADRYDLEIFDENTYYLLYRLDF